MKNQITMVLGQPRSGSNMVAAIIRKLGVPGPSGETDEKPSVMPSGNFFDVEFNMGRVERKLPWVFKTHGFRTLAQNDAFLKRDDMAVILTTRNAGSEIKSLIRRCGIELGLSDDAAEIHASRRWRILTRRFKRFAMSWGGPKLILDYDSICKNPKKAVHRIANFVGANNQRKIQDAEKLVKAKLNHFPA